MADSKVKKITCNQEGCKASTDGVCLEGLALESCPHCSIVVEDKTDINIVKINDENVNESSKPILHDVHTGEELSLEETMKVTCSSLTRLIILAGLPNVGKTTLLASLFDLYQKRDSLAGYIFAGSKTLIGFEKRCHDSRITSERATEETLRTNIAPPLFLHLKVKKDGVARDLLFTDISGELFKTLSDSTTECKKFELAKRADHFVLFIDSDHISELNKRQVSKTRSIEILRSLSETQMLNIDTYIHVVFSRWDLLKDKDETESHEQFVEKVKEEIINKFSNTHKNISFSTIACRPKNTEIYQFGYGIEELFRVWVEKSPFIYKMNNSKNVAKSITINREFSKFQYLQS